MKASFEREQDKARALKSQPELGARPPVREITCVVSFMSAEAGGRMAPPMLVPTGQYRPHILPNGPDQRPVGIAISGDGSGVVVDGEAEVTVILVFHPDEDYSAIVAGTRFAILEGAKVVGHGRVI